MDDDQLIQNRYQMRDLLQTVQAIYDANARAYEFNPNSYSFEAMQRLGFLLRDVRQLFE
jgi:hypothetical protein